MPYFLYRVQPFAQLQPLGEFATFPEASREAQAGRAAGPAQEKRRVRVIFAENALAAEDLLLQVREPQPGGDGD
jgi:hypothetical protein